MKTLQIHIPSELQNNPFLARTDAERFVIDAIMEKIERTSPSALELLLAEGYRASRTEDAQIMNDFKSADFENL